MLRAAIGIKRAIMSLPDKVETWVGTDLNPYFPGSLCNLMLLTCDKAA